MDLTPTLHPGATVSFVGCLIVRGSHLSLCQTLGHRQPFLISLQLKPETTTFAIFHGRVKEGHPLLVDTSEAIVIEHQPWTGDSFERLIEACAGIGALGVGCRFANVTTVVYNDINPNYCKWLKDRELPVVEGHIGHDATIIEIATQCPGPSMLAGGVACQPYSSIGDRREHRDSRSDSLKGLLRAGVFLACPIIFIECVREAQQTSYVTTCIAEFQALTGYVRYDRHLHLQDLWPSRRSRWWCVLCPPQLGVCGIPEMPSLRHEPTASELMPFLPIWDQAAESELELDLYELRIFKDYGGSGQSIHPNRPVQTALHSWGSQAKACACGCRNAGFKLDRLASKGLFGAVISLEGERRLGTNQYDRLRHMHPDEVALYNALPPNHLSHSGTRHLRFELSGVGQLASPVQSLWVVSNVLNQLNVPLPHEPVDPVDGMGNLFRSLFEARDEMLQQQIHHPQCEQFEASLASLFPKASRHFGCRVIEAPVSWNAIVARVASDQQVPDDQTEQLCETDQKLTNKRHRSLSMDTPKLDESVDSSLKVLKRSELRDIHPLPTKVEETNFVSAPITKQCQDGQNAEPQRLFAENGGITCFASTVPEKKINLGQTVQTPQNALPTAVVADEPSPEQFPVFNDPKVLIQVDVGFLGQPLMKVVAPQTATVGQVSVAFAELTQVIPHCRPQDIVGQFVSVSRQPYDKMILLMNDPTGFQSVKCPIEGSERPLLPTADTRESLLLQQEAWVARDEMDFYLQTIQEHHELLTCLPDSFGMIHWAMRPSSSG